MQAVPGVVQVPGVQKRNQFTRIEEVDDEKAARLEAELNALHAQQESEKAAKEAEEQAAKEAQEQAAKELEEQAAQEAEEQAAKEQEEKKRKAATEDEAAQWQQAKRHKTNWEQHGGAKGKGDKPRGTVGHSTVINLEGNDDNNSQDKWKGWQGKRSWDSGSWGKGWKDSQDWRKDETPKGQGKGHKGKRQDGPKLGCIVL